MRHATQGHALFRRWVDALGSQQAAAERICCSQVNVSEIYRGNRLPTTPLQARIRDASAEQVEGWDGSAISLDAWAEPASVEAAAAEG